MGATKLGDISKEIITTAHESPDRIYPYSKLSGSDVRIKLLAAFTLVNNGYLIPLPEESAGLKLTDEGEWLNLGIVAVNG